MHKYNVYIYIYTCIQNNDTQISAPKLYQLFWLKSTNCFHFNYVIIFIQFDNLHDFLVIFLSVKLFQLLDIYEMLLLTWWEYFDQDRSPRMKYSDHVYKSIILLINIKKPRSPRKIYCIEGIICPLLFLPSLSVGFKTGRIQNIF